ncbi:FAD dependent oxidoreductase [Cunninghamella echinulata]|nr:FAD dependent oxidoreductase [Cunninghamella echinulata]
MHIIIVGAGCIGSCTAYYLSSRDNVKVTIIEKVDVACASSGKAGGFLWRDGSGELSKNSYKLHEQLAEKLKGEKRYGYRQLDTYSVTMTDDHEDITRRPSNNEDQVPWLYQHRITHIDRLAEKRDTAQVHPKLFTETIIEQAQSTGKVELITGIGVQQLLYHDNSNKVAMSKMAVKGVILENGDTIVADKVILCMGPWSSTFLLNPHTIEENEEKNVTMTSRSKQKQKYLPIDTARAHSIVVQVPRTSPIGAQALFTAILDQSKLYEPEVYPRSDGTVYICSATDEAIPLPSSADQVTIDPEAIRLLKRLCIKLSPHIINSVQDNVLIEQACYLPISRDGHPLIGKHPRYENLYVSAGHSVWGILLSPISGLIMTELVLNGTVSCVSYEALSRISLDSRA